MYCYSETTYTEYVNIRLLHMASIYASLLSTIRPCVTENISVSWDSHDANPVFNLTPTL